MSNADAGTNSAVRGDCWTSSYLNQQLVYRNYPSDNPVKASILEHAMEAGYRQWPASNLESLQACILAGAKMEHSKKLNSETTAQLRKLAHDLSNAIETVIQASYLLNQTKLDSQSKKWLRMIESAADEAAQINRGLREVLRSQSSRTQIIPSEKPAQKRRAS